MGQIQNFFRSDFSMYFMFQNVLKSDLKKSWIFSHFLCFERYLSILKLLAIINWGDNRKDQQPYKKSGHFNAKFFLWIFALNLLIYVQKEFHSYPFVFAQLLFNLQRNLKRNIEKRAITLQNNFSNIWKNCCLIVTWGMFCQSFKVVGWTVWLQSH